MRLIRNGFAVSSAAAFRGVLFSALLAVAVSNPSIAAAQEVKQLRLSEQNIQGFLAATKEMAKLFGSAKSDLSKHADPNMQTQADVVVKKNGFASFAEFGEVPGNIMMILAGIDPQTKTLHEPRDLMKQAIAALKVDKSVPEAEKQERLALFEEALKDAKPVQFKENIALVLKYYDKLPHPATHEREALCALDLRFSCGP